MRIIGGTARGKKLATFDGHHIRPTPDRVREALFSILISRFGSLHGLKVLDLFAGSGAQALEAVSRGAECAVMIDQDRDSLAIIRENIRRCGFADHVSVIAGTLPQCLDKTVAAGPFHLIFMDPPYDMGLVEPVIGKIDSLNLLTDDGIICAETSRREIPDYQGSLVLLESRFYGSTGIHLFGFP